MIVNASLTVTATPENPNDVVRLEDLAGLASKSRVISFTLSAKNWRGDSNIVTIKSITPTCCADISLATTVTAEQVDALLNAKLVVTNQNFNTVTFKAFGHVPKVDIPMVCENRGEPYAD